MQVIEVKQEHVAVEWQHPQLLQVLARQNIHLIVTIYVCLRQEFMTALAWDTVHSLIMGSLNMSLIFHFPFSQKG